MNRTEPSVCPLIDCEAESIPPPPPTPVRSALGHVLLGVSLLLVAFNLRGPVSSVGPVLQDIVRDTGLASALASLLVTLPTLCFGLAALATPPITRRFGTEWTLFGNVVLLVLGSALRALGGVPALYAGQILASVTIGVLNVLIPSLLKRDFPNRLPLMTGLYTMMLCASGAAGAGVTVPLATALGGSWAGSLGLWAVPAAVAALVWVLFLPRKIGSGAHDSAHVRGLWRDPLAWHVMLFMGLQSGFAYTVFGWIPSMLRDRGFSPVDAGLILSVSVLCQAGSSLVAPSLAARGASQSVANVAALALTVIGLVGCFFAPVATIWLWAALLGLGQGALFALGVTMIVLRSPNAQVAAHLSGMAQGGGYLIASATPLLAGLLYGWTGGWTAVALLCVGTLALAAVSGWISGRPLYVKARVESAA